jgi:Pyruvate/2-oxoacid:ferredoxin oxidoreductase delta subunit
MLSIFADTQDGCTNGEIHNFTLCYFSSGRQQRRGRVKLGKTTRLGCLECKVWMWCPPLNTRWRPKWGSSHLYNTVDLLLIYDYCHGIVCTIITITMVLYEWLLLWHCLYAKLRFCEVLYINIHIGHAKIFINLPPGNHTNVFGFYVCLTGLSKKLSGNRSLPIGKPFQTECTSLLVWLLNLFGF